MASVAGIAGVKMYAAIIPMTTTILKIVSGYNGWGDKSDDDDGFEDCEWCGYTHHYEDKCPNEATVKYYKKWRE